MRGGPACFCIPTYTAMLIPHVGFGGCLPAVLRLAQTLLACACVGVDADGCGADAAAEMLTFMREA